MRRHNSPTHVLWQWMAQGRVLALWGLLIFAHSASAQDLEDIKEIEEIEEASAWGAEIKLSFVSTTGNTESRTFAGKLEIEGVSAQYRFFFDGRVITQAGNGVETANQVHINGRAERAIGERFFLLFESKFSRDTFSGYDYRFAAGPGVGYDFVTGEHAAFKAFVSAIYHYHNFSLGDIELDNYLGLRAAALARVRLQENVLLKNGFDYLTSSKESAVYFIDNETSVDVKVNNNISLGVSYLLRYENQPATAELDKLNTTFLTSLVFSF